MILFLLRGSIHLRAHGRRSRGQLLRLVEGLGANLSNMVDAHEAGYVATLLGVHLLRFRSQPLCRVGALRAGRTGNRAQRDIEFSDQRIHVCLGMVCAHIEPSPH
jgi:hypothetical protein